MREGDAIDKIFMASLIKNRFEEPRLVSIPSIPTDLENMASKQECRFQYRLQDNEAHGSGSSSAYECAMKPSMAST